MLKFTLTLLLINTFNCGWSVSLHLKSNGKPDSNDMLASNLVLLADSCHHKFISTEIQDKFAECSLPSLGNVKYLKCLMFYDINIQLCNSTLDLRNEDFNTRLNEKLDVIEFCGSASSWPATDLDIDSHYSKTFMRIFSNPHFCSKFCESQDIFVDDVDFYCKYYKWGLDALTKAKSQNDQTTQIGNVISIKSDYNIESSTESPNDRDTYIVSNNLTPTTVNAEAIGMKKETSELSSIQAAVNESISEIDVAVAHQLGITSSEQMPSNQDPVNQPDEKMNSTNTLPKEDTVLYNTPKIHPKLQVINNQADLGDNKQVSEEVSGNAFSELDLIDDTDIDGNLDLGPLKDTVISYREPNLREVYTSVIQESFTEDKDDHFFSLFLTGVLLVILLYVLYYNKNKVSRVVMVLVGKRASHHALPTKMRY